ncbi:hypothetical protein AVEN_186435-1 [Araneus ventricosus]|uniref:CCHC-type domain-containing protein n=1 Tax=Araneus ventricosus TaxID=182803 RepID=A0A4Y1ZJ68_ARAVE|nr:hypothetical protein AVEN_186435-1 [Araneus ventricosus]
MVKVRDLLTELDKFSTTSIETKLTYGKKLRNKITVEYLDALVNIIKDLCDEIRSRDANIFDLQSCLTDCDLSLMRAKIWSLEREKAVLQAKLDLQSEFSSSFKELLPKIDDLKEINNQNLNIREEIPKILKLEREAACSDFKEVMGKANTELVEEVKRNINLTKSFAQVAQSSRDLLPSERSTRPPPVLNPEGITLVKPKNENVGNFETNKKLIIELLRKKDPVIRLRSIGKIHGGGLKLVSASLDDAKVIKDLLYDTEDNDLLSSFEFSIPPRRSPQIIVYNVDKKVEPDVFKKGLLAKNLFLADANNAPKFKAEFNIPSRNKELVHWILTINPKNFHEIMDKEGLYFEFSRLRFSEFIGIKQCKKCFLFGHTTKQCKEETPRKCDNCGVKNIDVRRDSVLIALSQTLSIKQPTELTIAASTPCVKRILNRKNS